MRCLLLALACLLFASAAAAQAGFCLSQDALLFGNQFVGSLSSQGVTVSNCGSQPWTFTNVVIDPATGPAWHVNTNCATGLTLAPGAACSVTVMFEPMSTGQTSGGLWLSNTTGTSDDLLVFYGRGIDARAGTASLSFSPSALVFGTQQVGTQSPDLVVTLFNSGPASLTPSAYVITGPAAYDYNAVGNCPSGKPLAPGASCTWTFFFIPASLGDRPASLVVDAPELANLAILPIDGIGAAAPTPDANVIEFYDPAVNHYFLTASAAEAAYIDAGGAGPGWVRTGYSFRAWSLDNAAPRTLPVCRFTGTPNVGPNSHFYTAFANECTIVQANPYWLYEGLVFRMLIPSTGACPDGTSPVVRFYWPGNGDVTLARHRYVVDPSEAARMRAANWIEEGPVFCAPT
ncbi:MAG TPA: choice-of-anchor D domain-containing protein [Casimicrobiaceae bacterium]|jgi:hypothetical protein|nr:choice-of-anchor D domain-containing protein [Casimicrobiaceae bacterium]